MGVGDSIIYRERVQDAADTVVFAGAVYHARGMNVIATLNIVMAALLGLVVAARLLQFLNTVAMFISCGCIPVPFIGGICGTVCQGTVRLQQPLFRAVKALTRLYNKVGPILSKTQTGVAVAMPWVAEAKAIGVSRKYSPDVRLGVIASASLVPLPPDWNLGLPVKEGDDSVLCGKVSSGIVDLVLTPLPFLVDPVRGWVTRPLTGFVENFCGGGDLVDEEEEQRIKEEALQEQIDERCGWEERVSYWLNGYQPPYTRVVEAYARLYDERRDHLAGNVDLTKIQCYPLYRDNLLANLNDPTPPEPWRPPEPGTDPLPPCSFNRSRCEERARREIEERREEEMAEVGAEETPEIDEDARRKTRPKIVIDSARNGNGYFQVLSLIWANDSRARRLAPAVEVADHGDGQAQDPSFWASLGFAQAEFYYDTTEPWSDDIASAQAMWNLRWRARLRRVGPLTVPNVVTDATSQVTGEIRARVEQVLGSPPEEENLLADFMERLVLFKFDEAADDLKNRATEVDNEIERKVRDRWNKILGIH
jgi:hypothetical protein